MTTHLPLKYGCVATIESDAIDRPAASSTTAPPKPPPKYPHADLCCCVDCRPANPVEAI